MENLEKDFISVDEAAKLLGVHRTTLRAWVLKEIKIKKNNLPYPELFKCPPFGRIGSRFLFRRDDIEKFINDSMNNG